MPSSSRHTIGEALIVSVALFGFFGLVYGGRANVGDLLPLSAVLLVATVFYGVLLLIRAVFTFMTGDDGLWRTQEQEPKKRRWGRSK